MTDPVPFTFDACEDAASCRAGIRELLAPGMDWSDVHCGRCGRQGIVRHADLMPAAEPAPEPAPEAVAPVDNAIPDSHIESGEDAPAAAPERKGGRS
ncbi:hypothetical protein [Methylobacterium oryzae]|uniref:hypothetical protein n=1 Tax=Methylobacterium oryzae TaxID=334852 RepID=UPI002F335A25